MGTKKIRFAGITVIVLVNLLILVLVEGVLRVTGIGLDTHLLLRRKIENNEYLVLNRYYIRQFMQSGNVALPVFDRYIFSRVKQPGTFRVFVFGESTSQGFPFAKTEAFPFQLEQMLSSAKTSKRIEVINFSVAAINSHIGRQMVREAIKYEPDCVVIYFGHNEFIGIGGAGSFKAPLYQLQRALYQLRIYQEIVELSGSLRKSAVSDLMQAMASKPDIPFRSKTYQSTISDFQNNYTDMIADCRSRNIPVIGCGVVSNIKDLPPIETVKKGDRGSDVSVEAIVKMGSDTALMSHHRDESSGVWYRAGKELLARGEQMGAIYCMRFARDLDGVRFRAPSDVNRVISELCHSQGSTYIDFQHLVDVTDSTGITGNAQLVEHVHPSVAVHRLIASTLADTVLTKHFNKMPPPDGYQTPVITTLVEKEVAAGKMRGMFSLYPYRDLHYFNPLSITPVYTIDSVSGLGGIPRLIRRPDIDSVSLEVIQNLLRRRLDIDDVHVGYGEYLASERQAYSAAYQEFVAAMFINPLNWKAINNVAVCHAIFGNPAKAISLWKQILGYKIDSPEVLCNALLVLKQSGGSIQLRQSIEQKLVSKKMLLSYNQSLVLIKP